MMMEVLVWILLLCCLLEGVSSWLFRRRLKAQHKMLTALFSNTSTRLRADADAWRAKAWDESLPKNERRQAYGFAMAYAAGAHAYADVAEDI
jgi:hypothetical protein